MGKKKPLFQRVVDPRIKPSVPRIRKLGATERFGFICLSPSPWGFVTHWSKKRQTKPCIAHRAICEHCVDLCPKRTRGYLLATDQSGAILGFVDLTPDAFQTAREIERATGSLRGRWFVVFREPQQLRGAMILQPLPPGYGMPAVLPADLDPEPSLTRVWGLDNVA